MMKNAERASRTATGEELTFLELGKKGQGVCWGQQGTTTEGVVEGGGESIQRFGDAARKGWGSNKKRKGGFPAQEGGR